jgi:hypothetical protein
MPFLPEQKAPAPYGDKKPLPVWVVVVVMVAAVVVAIVQSLTAVEAARRNDQVSKKCGVLGASVPVDQQPSNIKTLAQLQLAQAT